MRLERRWGVVAAALVASGLGIALDLHVLGGPRSWLPDAVVGCAFVLAAAVLAWSGPAGRIAWLLAATGAAWFVGGLHPALVVLHRGPLVHLALSYPTGRLTRSGKVAVLVGYAASLAPVLWGSGAGTSVLASGLVAVAGAQVRTARGPLRQAKRQALTATAAFAALLVASSGLRHVLPRGSAGAVTLLVYEAALVAAAFLVVFGVLRASRLRAPVTDLVLQLESRSGVVADALGRVLGDPALRVGYWSGERYVDAAGTAVPLPQAGDGRAATPVQRRGVPLAVLVHDEAVLADPALLDAVSTAARLSEENTALQDAVARRLREVEDSRVRLLASGDDERARLVQRLADGAERRLVDLEACLLRAGRSTSGSALDDLERARVELARTRADLQALAGGLDPHRLAAGGLRSALDDLASRSPLPVQVCAPEGALPPELAATVWFVCAEAVANAVRHAAATAVQVQLAVEDERLRLTVTDDGSGGADPAKGTGLRGLQDRVEALGGELHVSGAAGGGTVVHAVLPHPGGTWPSSGGCGPQGGRPLDLPRPRPGARAVGEMPP